MIQRASPGFSEIVFSPGTGTNGARSRADGPRARDVAAHKLKRQFLLNQLQCGLPGTGERAERGSSPHTIVFSLSLPTYSYTLRPGRSGHRISLADTDLDPRPLFRMGEWKGKIAGPPLPVQGDGSESTAAAAAAN